MLHLVEDIVLLQLHDHGVLPLVVVALGQQLLLHLGRTAPETHLVELGQIVAQAQAALCPGVYEKVHQLHYPLGGLIEGKGAAVPPAQLLQELSPLCILPGEKAAEHEAAEIKAGYAQSRHRGAAAGYAHHLYPRLHGGLYELVARV